MPYVAITDSTFLNLEIAPEFLSDGSCGKRQHVCRRSTSSRVRVLRAQGRELDARGTATSL